MTWSPERHSSYLSLPLFTTSKVVSRERHLPHQGLVFEHRRCGACSQNRWPEGHTSGSCDHMQISFVAWSGRYCPPTYGFEAFSPGSIYDCAQRWVSPAADSGETRNSENHFFCQMAAAYPRRRRSGAASVGRNRGLNETTQAFTLFPRQARRKGYGQTTLPYMAQFQARHNCLRKACHAQPADPTRAASCRTTPLANQPQATRKACCVS